MKTKLAIMLSLTLAINAHAGSATWNLNPATNDWNDATNWTPNMVPNAPTDVATFDDSNLTDILIDGAIDTVDHIEFTPNAGAFTITVKSEAPPVYPKLIFSGTGIINESGVTQNFVTVPNRLSYGPSLIEFHNGATVGDGIVFTNTAFVNGTPTVEFFDNSSAGTATFITQGGGALFHDDSSAASAMFIDESQKSVQFSEDSAAANATFLVEGDSSLFFDTVSFNDNATAGSANFTVTGGSGSGGQVKFLWGSSADHGTFTIGGTDSEHGISGKLFFYNTSTAGDAFITLKGGLQGRQPGGTVLFVGPSLASTAGNSTIIAENGPGPGGGGLIFFSGGSTGGTARLELLGPTGPGTLQVELSPGNDGVTVGSIEGSGLVILTGAGSATTLSIGSNNLSTTFSGLIQDGDRSGSIGKIGTGTLILSGANTYTGGTTISSGILLVNNTSGSGTGTGAVSVNAGTLGGSGIIAGAVTVGTNTGVPAFLAPSKGVKKPATLTIQGALTLNDDSTYIYKLDTKIERADEVMANGVVIDNGAKFSLRPSGNNALTVGQVFTVIKNTSASPIAGTFHNLRNGRIILVNGSNLQASYTGGDGNDLTLTVVP